MNRFRKLRLIFVHHFKWILFKESFNELQLIISTVLNLESSKESLSSHDLFKKKSFDVPWFPHKETFFSASSMPWLMIWNQTFRKVSNNLIENIFIGALTKAAWKLYRRINRSLTYSPTLNDLNNKCFNTIYYSLCNYVRWELFTVWQRELIYWFS